MKKIVPITFSAALLLAAGLTASAARPEEEVKAHFKPYGFIRAYGIVDSRKSKSLTEEIFYFVPEDVHEVNGQDVNAVPDFKYQALTSRLGLDILGYRYRGTAIEGKIEADFYCLNSGGNTPTLRMRQAYADLKWDAARIGRHNVPMHLVIGQTWHPMAVDMPNCINLETGAPFNPFNRSAQVMYNATFFKKLTVTAGILEQLQYRSVGPVFSGTSVSTAGSNKYQMYAMIPEMYFGLTFKTGGFMAKGGVDLLWIKPRYGYTAAGERIQDLLFTASPFVYVQYTSGLFQVKAKSIIAQAGEHMQLLSGYALTSVTADNHYNYSPLQQTASFVSLQYGKTVQGMIMLGYAANLGTIDPVIRLRDSEAIIAIDPDRDINSRDENLIFFSANGYKNIKQMVRATPTVVYNLGKMQFGLEYDITGAQYGDVTDLNKYGVVQSNLHWVFNHRVSLMAKFTF